MSDFIPQRWLDAQTGAIGSVLIKPSLAGQLLTETSAEDFTSPAKEIYAAMQSLYGQGKPCDPMLLGGMVNDALRNYMLQAIEVTPSAANFDLYIADVKDKAQIWRLQSALADAANATDLQQLQAAVDTANAALIQSRGSRWKDAMQLASSFYDRKRCAEKFQTTGIRALDKHCRMRPGDVFVIGARPSVGKTALAIQMALQMARVMRVGFFGMDTSEPEFQDRCISHLAGIDFGKVQDSSLSDDEWDSVAKAARDLTSLSIGHCDCAGYTIDDIFREAISAHLDIIFIDYLQLISVPGRDRYTDMTNVVIKMQQLAQKNKITVFCLSQLNRQSSGEPSMSDLRETGQLEQAANVIGLLYRENADDADSIRILKIAKNRGGRLVKARLWWDGATQTFTPITQTQEPQKQTEEKQTALHWQQIGQRSRTRKYLPMPETDEQKAAGDGGNHE